MLIPAYQAEASIAAVIQPVKALGLAIIVVDDASQDATTARAREAGAVVVTRHTNGGKGAALRDGVQAAFQGGFQWILTMDADGQHLPAEIPRFLEAAAAGKADLVVGNRMPNLKNMPWERRWTNWGMSWLLSRAAHQPLPDTQCGFRLISRRVLEAVPLMTDRFETESELVVKAARAGFRIQFVPITAVYRDERSFIRPMQDTFRFFRFLRSLRSS